jgi:hypothetical protein
MCEGLACNREQSQGLLWAQLREGDVFAGFPCGRHAIILQL